MRQQLHTAPIGTDPATAAACLAAGAVIAIPTDTVYGLAAALNQPSAIEQIFAIKGRATTKALPVLVASVNGLEMFAGAFDPAVGKLAERFWPGALTIVVQANQRVPLAVRGGGSSVGLRMPDHELALRVLDLVGGGLAVTSANHSGAMECRSAADVRRLLGAKLGYILDGGELFGTTPSTVLDTTARPWRLVREGGISREALASVAGQEIA